MLLSDSTMAETKASIPKGRLTNNNRVYSSRGTWINPGLITRTPNQPEERLISSPANDSVAVRLENNFLTPSPYTGGNFLSNSAPDAVFDTVLSATGRVRPAVSVQPDGIEVKKRGDDKKESEYSSAVINFSQLIGTHDVTSLDKSIATTIHADPYINDRAILNTRSENDTDGMAAGVMSINPNHPAPKFANTSDNTFRVAGSLSFIMSHFTTLIQSMSNLAPEAGMYRPVPRAI